jgi:thiopurine S-methyltransferase
MELEFWQKKWRDDQIGFHLDEVHPYLLKYWKQLGLEGLGRVFVPLCGKSVDMVWLRDQGHELIGVEYSPIAIASFCDQVGGEFITDQVGVLDRYTGKGYSLLIGDYFALDRNIVGAVAGVYDRASLIALPEAKREDYVALQREILPVGAQILLITIEYDQSEMTGPPFSIDANAVKSLYADWCDIELLESSPEVVASPNKDLDIIECCYRLRVR